MGRSAVGIDIGTVRIVMNGYHAAAQFLQTFHGSVERCAFRTVHYDLQSGQIHIYRSHRMVNVFFSGIRAVFDLADAGSDRELNTGHIVPDQSLDLILYSIRKLITVAVEELDSVKFHRIVRGGDHNSRIYFVFFRQISHCRGRDHSYIDAVGTYRTGSCHQGICQHISGNSSIAAYHDGGFMLIFLSEHISSGLT